MHGSKLTPYQWDATHSLPGARRAWAEWLATAQKWDAFATLTFRPRKRRDGTEARLTGYNCRPAFYTWLGKCLRIRNGYYEASAPPRSGFGYYVVEEFGRSGDRLHFHALVSGLGRLHPLLMEDRWRLDQGIARVELPRSGAEYYVTKYATKTPDAWCRWDFPRAWRRPYVAVSQEAAGGPTQDPQETHH